MVVWFRQSIKKLNDEKAEKRLRSDEIAELQDALVEIADIISGFGVVRDGKDEENG